LANSFCRLSSTLRELGWAFAAALVVHLGFVIRLYVVGSAPSTETFIIFGVAAESSANACRARPTERSARR
jgi:hypothetical protein